MSVLEILLKLIGCCIWFNADAEGYGYGERPSIVGERLSVLGERLSVFGEGLSVFGEGLSVW